MGVGVGDCLGLFRCLGPEKDGNAAFDGGIIVHTHKHVHVKCVAVCCSELQCVLQCVAVCVCHYAYT